MSGTRDYLRDAKIHEAISGVFGWIWILGFWAALGVGVATLLGHGSWFLAIGVFLGSQFCKPLAREYAKTARDEILAGIAAGQLTVDANNQARRVDPVVDSRTL